jgi:Methyltransferase domain
MAAGCTRAPVLETEVRVLLPRTSVDPLDQRRFGKLTINDREFEDVSSRKRAFKIKLKTARESLTVTYSFWPQTYTNIIRTKVASAASGEVVEVDLTREDPANPDQIQPIFYTTPMPVVERMCRLAKIGPNDVVWDIGCGDGRMVIMAIERFGAKQGVGIDIEPALIAQSKENARKAGVLEKIDFRVQDALTLKDFSDATVVMLFVGENLNLKLRPLLRKTLKPGARVVSHYFDMGDWNADQTDRFNAVNNDGVKEEFTLHLWTIK